MSVGPTYIQPSISRDRLFSVNRDHMRKFLAVQKLFEIFDSLEDCTGRQSLTVLNDLLKSWFDDMT